MAQYLDNPEMKLYFHFLHFILAPLNEFNTLFQSDETLVGMLVPEMKMLTHKMLSKFVSMEAVKGAPELTKVDYRNEENWHSNDRLAIGLPTRTYLKEVEDTISESTKSRFFASVRNFYIGVLDKIVKKFPFGDQTLANIEFMNPKVASEKMNNEVTVNFAQRFNLVCTDDLDQLEGEARVFHTLESDALPPFEETERADKWWHKTMQMKTPRGVVRFPLLKTVVQAILTIPNSNAESERSFSMMKKIHTMYRSQMCNETRCALMATKMNADTECYNFTVDKDLCKKAKSATWSYVQKHK